MPTTKVRRRRIRWKRVFFVFVLLMFFVAASAGVAAYAFLNIFHNPATVVSTMASQPDRTHSDKQLNILLLGVDDGDYGNSDSDARHSDTMIVANVNLENAAVNLLSIPRDTKVLIPGHKGYDKITEACFYGGPSLAVRTTEDFLNISIDHYILINWQAFIDIVDILGGVDLYVEHNMDYEDPYANLSIHLSKGYQHLNGQKAGEYVRFRHDELGDIGRVQRQQVFLKALSEQMFRLGTIAKLPSLVKALKQHVQTDMKPMAMVKLANALKGFKTGTLHCEMLPGNFATIGGLSYWEPDKIQTEQLVQKMFALPSAKPDNISYNK